MDYIREDPRFQRMLKDAKARLGMGRDNAPAEGKAS